MQHSNIGGMQDFRRFQDGERHIKAVRGAKRFFIVMGVLVLLAFGAVVAFAQDNVFWNSMNVIAQQAGTLSELYTARSGNQAIEALCYSRHHRADGGYWSLPNSRYNRCVKELTKAKNYIKGVKRANSNNKARLEAYKAAERMCYAKYSLVHQWSKYNRCKSRAFKVIRRLG